MKKLIIILAVLIAVQINAQTIYTSAQDIMLSIPMGNVSNMTVVNKFGANTSSADGVVEEVWDGSVTYSFPTTALMTSISQTTDQAAMRGAIIEIQGLDASWDMVTQNAVLDATLTTNIVTLATPLIRVFRMKVLANVVSASPIRVHNAGETVDYAIISTGNNQTLMAIYTVPAGKTAYMTKYYGDVVENVIDGKDPDATDFVLWVRDNSNGYAKQIKHARGVPKGSSGFNQPFAPYFKITEKSDVYVTTECVGKIGDVHAGFDLIIVTN